MKRRPFFLSIPLCMALSASPLLAFGGGMGRGPGGPGGAGGRQRRTPPDPAAQFARLDKDGSGELSSQELEQMLRQMGAKKPRENRSRGRSGQGRPGGLGGPPLKAIQQEFDQDQNGKLSPEEVTLAAQALLSRLDLDQSGGVSSTELATLGQEKQPPPVKRPSYLGQYDLDGNGEVTSEEIEEFRRLHSSQ